MVFRAQYRWSWSEVEITHHPVVDGNSNAFSAYKVHCLWILHCGNVVSCFAHFQLAYEVKMSRVELLLYIFEKAFRGLYTGSVPPNNSEIETIKLKWMCANRLPCGLLCILHSSAIKCRKYTFREKKLLPEKSVIQFRFSLILVVHTIQDSGIQFHCNVNLLYSTIRYFFVGRCLLPFDGIFSFRPISPTNRMRPEQSANHFANGNQNRMKKKNPVQFVFFEALITTAVSLRICTESVRSVPGRRKKNVHQRHFGGIHCITAGTMWHWMNKISALIRWTRHRKLCAVHPSCPNSTRERNGVGQLWKSVTSFRQFFLLLLHSSKSAHYFQFRQK